MFNMVYYIISWCHVIRKCSHFYFTVNLHTHTHTTCMVHSLSFMLSTVVYNMYESFNFLSFCVLVGIQYFKDVVMTVESVLTVACLKRSPVLCGHSVFVPLQHILYWNNLSWSAICLIRLLIFGPQGDRLKTDLTVVSHTYICHHRILCPSAES
jgi:hypothetical protein